LSWILADLLSGTEDRKDTPPTPEDPVDFARSLLNFQPDPRQCAVLDPSIEQGILNCTRQWGKSTIIAVKAVHHAFTRPESLVLAVSPSLRQSAEFVRKAAAFLRHLGIRRRGDGLNSASLILPNGARIVGLPGKEDTIRGFSKPGLILIDEAARVPEEMYEAVRPMLAVADGALWLMSTPNGKRGFFWDVWSTGGPEWTHIKVPAADCPRISARFLDRERRALGDRSFRQEYCCEFLESEDQLIRDDFIDRAIRSDIEPLKVNWRYK
jgi:hypothetical protein